MDIRDPFGMSPPDGIMPLTVTPESYDPNLDALHAQTDRKLALPEGDWRVVAEGGVNEATPRPLARLRIVILRPCYLRHPTTTPHSYRIIHFAAFVPQVLRL